MINNICSLKTRVDSQRLSAGFGVIHESNQLTVHESGVITGRLVRNVKCRFKGRYNTRGESGESCVCTTILVREWDAQSKIKKLTLIAPT